MSQAWVELRVHGVSGTPPESLLDRPHVVQVDGDDRSRFFQAVGADGTPIRGAGGQQIEGFHWGRYTSGTWLKSFWLVFLPFGLINMAAFMLPAPLPDGARYTAAARTAALAVLRLLGLLLTILFSLAIGMTLIEVVGAQCRPGWTGRTGCVTTADPSRWPPPGWPCSYSAAGRCCGGCSGGPKRSKG